MKNVDCMFSHLYMSPQPSGVVGLHVAVEAPECNVLFNNQSIIWLLVHLPKVWTLGPMLGGNMELSVEAGFTLEVTVLALELLHHPLALSPQFDNLDVGGKGHFILKKN